MNFLEILLTLMPIAAVVGVPAYIYFREKMVRRPKTEKDYSARRVIKLTFINFFLNALASSYFLTIYVLLLSRSPVISLEGLILGSVLIFMINLTFYGNGIYMTSIVLESYTLPQLRRIPSFVTQFIATHLFHGPISHVYIYSGWFLVLFILALMDISTQTRIYRAFWTLFIVGGAITGVVYAIAQIYNGTAPYQFITGTITFLIFSATLFMTRLALNSLPVGSFFFSLNGAFEISLLGYFFYLRVKHKHVDWDRSGY